MTIISESFNKANSDIIGPDLTWTEVSGDLDIVSNAANKVSSAAENFARAEHNLATDDHYAQIVITGYGSSPSVNNHEIHARWSASGQTFYRSLTRNSATNTHRLFKRVAGVDTQIGPTVDETPPTPPVTIRIEAEGSTIRYIVNGVTKIEVVDTDITGNLRCGFGASGGGTGNTFDSFEAGDLVVPEVSPGLIDQSATVFAPQIDLEIALGLIDQAAQIFDPEIVVSIEFGLIDQTGQVFTPQVDLEFAVGLIDQSAVVFAPRVDLAIELGLIDQSGVVFDPGVDTTGVIVVELIDNTAVVFAPVITGEQIILVPILNYEGQVFAPRIVDTSHITRGIIGGDTPPYFRGDGRIGS